MNVGDDPLTLRCGDDWLLAMLSRPAEPRDTAVVVIVGGPQYRAGSHRQFVLLARGLAAAGCPVLRFDARGMGDSDGDARTFESIDDDIGAAIDGVRRALRACGGSCCGACATAPRPRCCTAGGPSPTGRWPACACSTPGCAPRRRWRARR